MTAPRQKISVVTPTLRRPVEVLDLLENLSAQTILPHEVILVDGAPPEETETEMAVKSVLQSFPFEVRYIRHSGGTAIQRNVGIDTASGDFIALVDDDVRLDKNFLSNMVEVFCADEPKKIGGIVGYRTNRHFRAEDSERWRWYKRLKLLTIYEPGRYDFESGYPINNNLQPPFEGVRPVDFMTTACAVWRREVFDSGLRFHPFFYDYGVLEDAHFSLRAKRDWILLQNGDAHCEELHSPHGRENNRQIGYKCVVNYYFVFQDIMRPLSLSQKFRFWRFQAFEFFRIGASALRRGSWSNAQEIFGRVQGVFAVLRGAAKYRGYKFKS
ncbi:MAG: glycosyltransferase family 2 protein [Actinomycetota bacterium]